LRQTLTSLGIGEALVTTLDARGVPTPLAVTRLVPPDSSMTPLEGAALATLQVRSGAAPEAVRPSRGTATAPPEPTGPTAAERRAEEGAARRSERLAAERLARERRAADRELGAVERAKARRTETLIRAGTRIITSRQGQRAIGGLLRGLLRRR
jgi:hypothetical protein